MANRKILHTEYRLNRFLRLNGFLQVRFRPRAVRVGALEGAMRAKRRRKLVLTPVAVEKLLRPKFAKIKLRYDARQTTFLIFETFCIPQVLAVLEETGVFQQPRLITSNILRHRPMPSFTKPDFPKLPDKLREDLRTITPSMDGGLSYWPCAARMRDGTVLLCVYVVAEDSYIKHWGVYPQQDRSKSYISLSDVDALAESPYRLPAQFANELYKSGESRMGGYTIFTLLFSDGTRQAYGRGNALDFIRYPEGKSGGDVIGVVPHEGREAELMSGPEPYWCLFSEVITS